MHIISGKYKGRTIKIPKGIRPTQNKVRKAVFDILADVSGLRVLELFAGSGAVGLEALSLGAAEAVFVEGRHSAAAVLRSNLSFLPEASYEVIAKDALRAIERLSDGGERFDLIFLDPPYYKGLAKKILQTISGYDIVSAAGNIVVQCFRKDELPQGEGRITCWKQARYGDTILAFYNIKHVPESDISRDI